MTKKLVDSDWPHDPEVLREVEQFAESLNICPEAVMMTATNMGFSDPKEFIKMAFEGKAPAD